MRTEIIIDDETAMEKCFVFRLGRIEEIPVSEIRDYFESNGIDVPLYDTIEIYRPRESESDFDHKSYSNEEYIYTEDDYDAMNEEIAILTDSNVNRASLKKLLISMANEVAGESIALVMSNLDFPFDKIVDKSHKESDERIVSLLEQRNRASEARTINLYGYKNLRLGLMVFYDENGVYHSTRSLSDDERQMTIPFTITTY